MLQNTKSIYKKQVVILYLKNELSEIKIKKMIHL